MKIVLKGNYVYIVKVRAYISQFISTYVMINMKLLEVVTTPSIYKVESMEDICGILNFFRGGGFCFWYSLRYCLEVIFLVTPAIFQC